IRRALRVFPIYYIVLVVTALGTIPHGHTDTLRFVPWYLFYLQNFHQAATSFQSGLPRLSHTWSLAIEEQFYFLWPLLVWLCPPRRLPYVAGGFVVVGMVYRVGALLLTENPFWYDA